MAKRDQAAPLRGKRLLRRKEVLERLSVGNSTLYDWLRQGRFPAPIRLGPNTVAWDEDAIDQFLADRRAA